MARKLLITLLVLSLLFELMLTVICFFAKESALNNIGAVFNADNDFLGYLIAWFCLFVSLICGYAIWRVVKNTGDYVVLCWLLGLWWIGIGVGLYIVFKKPAHLYTDSLKGLLVIILTILSAKNSRKVVYRS